MTFLCQTVIVSEKLRYTKKQNTDLGSLDGIKDNLISSVSKVGFQNCDEQNNKHPDLFEHQHFTKRDTKANFNWAETSMQNK